MLVMLSGCAPNTLKITHGCWVVETEEGFDRHYYYSEGTCGWVQGGGATMPNTYWAVVDYISYDKYFQDRAKAISYVEQYCKP